MALFRASMMRKSNPPAWVLGLCGTSFGLAAGFPAFALPQILAARDVPEIDIASITAVAISPGFWTFLLSPILDVWMSRRFYTFAFLGAAALLSGLGVLLLHDLTLLEVTMTAAYAANQLFYSALGGWLSTVCEKTEENRLSAWLTVGNTAGFGTMAVLGGQIVRSLPPASAALLIAGLILLPALFFVAVPDAPSDRRLPTESFGAFSADLSRLLSRREVWRALALFITPCATFSLTNLLGGLGGDFGATPSQISVLGGAGTAVAGVCGGLILPRLAKGRRLTSLYLAIGIAGSLFTLSLMLLPNNVWSFGVAILSENLLQGLAIACSIAIVFETIGESNPLSATNFALLTAAYNIPISYMLLADGWGYSRWRIHGALGVDAGLGIAACTLMAVLLFSRYRARWNAV